MHRLLPLAILLVGAAAPRAPVTCDPNARWSDACFLERLAENHRESVALLEATDRRLAFSLDTDARRNAADDAETLDDLKSIARHLGMTEWRVAAPESAGGIPLEVLANTPRPDRLFIDATLALRAETMSLASDALRYSQDERIRELARRQRDDAARTIGLLAARNYEIPHIDLSGRRRIWRGWR